MPLREASRLRYIADPGQHSLRWHWERYAKDKGVSYVAFEKWGTTDKWTHERARYWDAVRERISHEQMNVLVKLTIKELEKLHEIQFALLDKASPVRDATGKLVLDEFGQPTFSVKFKSYEGVIQAIDQVMKNVALKRGEATQRHETVVGEEGGEPRQTASALDPVSSRAALGQKELRALALTLMKIRPGVDEQLAEGAEDEDPVDALAGLPDEGDHHEPE